MSFHNQQGMENILPIAQKLCENELNEVSLLDLRELYGQPKISFQNLNNIFVKSENSIYKNIRNLTKINKAVFTFTKIVNIRNYANQFDKFIFSPGGFYEGLIAKSFVKNNKKTFFIEAGVKIYLFLKSQKSLQPKNNFLNNVTEYFTTGEITKDNLENFTSEQNKIFNLGVPRYSKIVSIHKNLKPFNPKQIKHLLFLTSASKYHEMRWEEKWQKTIIEDLVNSPLIDGFVLNIKVHPRDDNNNYKKFEQKKNVNILYNTNIEADILQNDCIISGPSTSIHEASLLGKVYITLWPFDKYENEYMPKVSTSENVPELISKIKQLNKDDSLQKEVYSTQLSLANKFINIDSDLSVKNIIEHIIN